MTITYFQRRPYDGAFSIETVFSTVRRALPANINWKIASSTFASRGLIRRLYNSLEAALRQSEINHITGDVHYLVCFLRKNKTVLTVHDCRSLHRLSGLRRDILKLFWYTVPCRRSAFITTVSEFTRSELIDATGCPPEKVWVIPDPVGPAFMQSPRPFDSNRPVILYVGVGSNKNLERSVAALRGISCRLHIIGQISRSQNQLLVSHGIDFSTDVRLSDDEVAAAYRNCDLVLFPSLYEGFGLPIVEGQATGRAVITSNLCSMPEVAGGAAHLVDPLDVNSIREGVLKVISDETYRQHLIESGFRNVSRFSADAIALQYVEVYNAVAKSQKVESAFRSMDVGT